MKNKIIIDEIRRLINEQPMFVSVKLCLMWAIIYIFYKVDLQHLSFYLISEISKKTTGMSYQGISEINV